MDATFRIERNSMILEEVATTIYTIIPLLVFISNTKNINTASSKIFNQIDIAEASLCESSALKCSFPFVLLKVIGILFNSMPLSKKCFT